MRRTVSRAAQGNSRVGADAAENPSRPNQPSVKLTELMPTHAIAGKIIRADGEIIEAPEIRYWHWN